MKKGLVFLAALVGASSALASGHTGFCRYGEECGGIVSLNQREAQRICSRDPHNYLTTKVYQEQRDGSVVFVGYVCTPPPGGH